MDVGRELRPGLAVELHVTCIPLCPVSTMLSILLVIFSRSQFARRASSSASLGIAVTSGFARHASRSTGKLDGGISHAHRRRGGSMGGRCWPPFSRQRAIGAHESLDRFGRVVGDHGQAQTARTGVERLRTLAPRLGSAGTAIDHLDRAGDQDFAGGAGLEERVAGAERKLRLAHLDNPFEKIAVGIDHRKNTTRTPAIATILTITRVVRSSFMRKNRLQFRARATPGARWRRSAAS